MLFSSCVTCFFYDFQNEHEVTNRTIPEYTCLAWHIKRCRITSSLILAWYVCNCGEVHDQTLYDCSSLMCTDLCYLPYNQAVSCARYITFISRTISAPKNASYLCIFYWSSVSWVNTTNFNNILKMTLQPSESVLFIFSLGFWCFEIHQINRKKNTQTSSEWSNKNDTFEKSTCIFLRFVDLWILGLPISWDKNIICVYFADFLNFCHKVLHGYSL